MTGQVWTLPCPAQRIDIPPLRTLTVRIFHEWLNETTDMVFPLRQFFGDSWRFRDRFYGLSFSRIYRRGIMQGEYGGRSHDNQSYPGKLCP